MSNLNNNTNILNEVLEVVKTISPVDQAFNPESSNAQSGIAVAEAIEQLNSEISTNLEDVVRKKELDASWSNFNITNGEGEGSVQQKGFTYNGKSVVFSDRTKGTQEGDVVPGAIASGYQSVAFGGLKYTHYTSPETYAFNLSIDSSAEENQGRTPTSAEGNQAFAAGGSVHAYGDWSIALGKDTIAYERGSIAMGGGSIAGKTEEEFNDFWYDFTTGTAKNGGKGLIGGKITDSQGDNYDQARAFSLSLGDTCKSIGRGSVALGKQTSALHQAAVAMGFMSAADADASVAIGYKTESNNQGAVAIGHGAKALGYQAVAFSNATSSGRASAAFGSSIASGDYSFVSGLNSQATGINSIAMGYNAKSGGDTSIVMGGNSTSERNFSIVLGQSSASYSNSGIAIGKGCVVGNADTSDTANFGVAIGLGTISTAYRQISIGRYNEGKPASIFEIGDGNSTTRKNVLDIDYKGVLRVYAAPSSALGDLDSCVVRKKELDELAAANKIYVDTTIREWVKPNNSSTIDQEFFNSLYQ